MKENVKRVHVLPCDVNRFVPVNGSLHKRYFKSLLGSPIF